MLNIIQSGLVVVLTVSSFSLWSNEEQQLQKVVGEQERNHQQGAESQKKISRLAEEITDLEIQHRDVLDNIERTRDHNEQLRKEIQDQKETIQSIREQIVEAKETNKDIAPLMQEMLEMLKQLIKADVPFLTEERRERLQKIDAIKDSADVTVSEKYRKIMEAYQREIEYGNTIENYHGFQNIEGKEVHVDYLRVGRLVLIYQTLDEKNQAYWNQQQRKWVELPSRYSKAVKKGFKVAKKQMTPSLLTLPVPAPQLAANYESDQEASAPAPQKPTSEENTDEENELEQPAPASQPAASEENTDGESELEKPEPAPQPAASEENTDGESELEKPEPAPQPAASEENTDGE